MQKYEHQWQQMPNRDEALNAIYDFLQALSQANVAKAASQLRVANMERFLELLNMSLQKYLDMLIEDEQWDSFRNRDISLELQDPYTMDEDLVFPEFSGKQFVLEDDESVSVKIGLGGEITPIKLHFRVVNDEGAYFMHLHRITA